MFGNWFTILFFIVSLVGAVTASSEPSAVVVCVDYHCDVQRTFKLSQEHWHSVRELFGGVDSAKAERNAVAHAIGFFEHLAGEQVGTAGDLPKNDADHGGPGQLDCIAESNNTERYLLSLQQASLLHWHDVKPRVSRSPLVFSTHWTAVLAEKENNMEFAVDSWYGGNGDAAYVVPIKQWLRGVGPGDTE